MLKAQARMKYFMDTKRLEVSYNMGDWVFVMLHSYRQHSVAFHCHYKLSLATLGYSKLYISLAL